MYGKELSTKMIVNRILGVIKILARSNELEFKFYFICDLLTFFLIA